MYLAPSRHFPLASGLSPLACSQRLQILQHGSFFDFVELVGEGVAGSAFAGRGGVKGLAPLCSCAFCWHGGRNRDFQSDFLLVVAILGSLPNSGALVGMQHVPERWHRAVVEIGRRSPHAVQGGRDVATRIAESLILAV